jgi:hypothetical protein
MMDRRTAWRDLCAAIAVEQDQNKILELSRQLLAILDALESRKASALSNEESSDDVYERVLRKSEEGGRC